MDERQARVARVIVAALLIGGVLLLPALFLGGQTSQILSTVGAAVNNNTGGGSTGTTGAGDTPAGPGDNPEVADAAGTIPTLLIVRTGELELTVADLDAAVRQGEAAVTRGGGYISASSRSASNGKETARTTYRIPSAAWSSTLDALRGLATTIVKDEVKTDEVTGQVVDLTAHIANLRASEAALQAIMTRATKVSDVLDVQQQLTTTRGEIEKLVAEKEHLVDQASFGSLAVTYRLPVVPTPTATPIPPKGWDPGDDVARASAKLVRIGQTSTSIGIWLVIVGLPLVVGGGLILLAGWQAARLTRWLAGRRNGAERRAA